MKKLSTLLSLATLTLLFACGGKHEDHQNHETMANDSVWTGMDEFHMSMAESFHPFKDSANLEPAKKYAAEMDSLATIWLQSPLPEKVNTDVVKEKLAKLKEGTTNFASSVKTESDEMLSKSLTDLHDQFHALQEAWYGGHEGHH